MILLLIQQVLLCHTASSTSESPSSSISTASSTETRRPHTQSWIHTNSYFIIWLCYASKFYNSLW